MLNSLYRKIFTIYLKTLKKRLSITSAVNERPRLFFGTVPLLNNKYWSNALKQAGYDSKTIMRDYYNTINQKEDFDLYANEIIETNYKKLPAFFRKKFKSYLLFDHILKNYDVLHISCQGIFSSDPGTFLDEAYWLKQFGKKIIVIPYGSDFLQYSLLTNYSYKFGLLYHYPNARLQEAKVKSRVDYWAKNSDAFILSNIPEGKPKWDLLPFVCLCIDIQRWSPKSIYSNADGVNGTVYIAHSPNHRALKGTEFIIQAIDELKKEGLKIELILLEKIQNEEIRKILTEKADVLAEQLLVGYALSGVEGMAVGLPVISNLENEQYTRLYRRYSYLNECPVLSSTPEDITHTLRILVKNPELRKTLGIAGRKYAEKYHSPESSVYMFEKIYEKVWFNKNTDLMNMYHPLVDNSYNNQSPRIEHPLFENKIPNELMSKLNK